MTEAVLAEQPPAAAAATSVALARLPAPPDQIEVTLGLPPGSFDPNGLKLTDSAMTFETWCNVAFAPGTLYRWARFALGDWLLFGEALFGEDSAQAVEGTAADRYNVAQRITGLKPATLQNYSSVCGRVPLPIRRTELDFSTHDAVAALDREEQIYWLDQAVVNGYDRDELREAIRVFKNPPADGDADGAVVVDPPLSRTERLERAAALVYAQGQPASDGSVLVPPAPWAQLAEALGEE